MNSKRKLTDLNAEFNRSMGTQKAQAAASGVKITSKSFLQIRNESLSNFDRIMLNQKIDFENQQRSKIFSTQVELINLENQARAADYTAAAETAMAANRAAEAQYSANITSLNARRQGFEQAGSLIGDIFK